MPLSRQGALCRSDGVVDLSDISDDVKARRGAPLHTGPSRHGREHPFQWRRAAKHDGAASITAFRQCQFTETLQVDGFDRSTEQPGYDDDPIIRNCVEGPRTLSGLGKKAAHDEVDSYGDEHECKKHEEQRRIRCLYSFEQYEEYDATPDKTEWNHKGIECSKHDALTWLP